MRFLWDYGGTARDFIRVMKYRPSVYLTRYGARLLTDALPTMFDSRDWDIVVPIPSSPQALRRRAFHPCYEMAKVLRRTLPHCSLSYALQHSRHRTPQARRTHSERLEGLKSLFTIHAANRIENKKVLLIEDVITTGATISAACQALRTVGASQVDVLALARARVWSRFRSRLHDIFQER